MGLDLAERCIINEPSCMLHKGEILILIESFMVFSVIYSIANTPVSFTICLYVAIDQDKAFDTLWMMIRYILC